MLGLRYGIGLQVLLLAAGACPPGVLLPLTLQTLVDNAIRHNALSAARPLRIEILPGAEDVRVHNTRRQRRICVPTRRDGLTELRARYQRLWPTHAVQVDMSEEKFSVLVPLITA